MDNKISVISTKYIEQLEKKKFFNTVKFKDAANSVKQAVEETANAAKKEIESAIEPLKAKIAQQDEFISQQTREKQSMQDKNNHLEKSVSSLKSELSNKEKVISRQEEEYKILEENNNELKAENKSADEKNDILRKSVTELNNKLKKYEGIVKEAYKQGITPEFREQKQGLADILSGLIQHKTGEGKKLSQKEQIKDVKPKPKATKPETTAIKPQKAQKLVKTYEKPAYKVNPEIIRQIEKERANQRLDKSRMNKAASLIKILLEDAPQETTYSSVQDYFKKVMNSYLDYARSTVNGRYKFEQESCSKIRLGTDKNGRIILKERGFDYNNDFHPHNYEIYNADGTSMEIYDGGGESYVEFRDTEGKELLKIHFSDHYNAFITNKNGELMVSEGIENGAIKYLSINFNDVKPIPAIENDEEMNIYTQSLIQKAKKDCKSQQKNYRDTTDIDYFNPEGKRVVCEYYVNKKSNPVPIFTYLFSPDGERLKKLISTGPFGLHAKWDDKKNCWVQYNTKGITGIDKRRPDGEKVDFRMGFYKSTDNEHFETQSLYDKNYKDDNDRFMQRAVCEKRNYGLASHPLTKSFTFCDLTKHNIKPWDFSILKPYIK